MLDREHDRHIGRLGQQRPLMPDPYPDRMHLAPAERLLANRVQRHGAVVNPFRRAETECSAVTSGRRNSIAPSRIHLRRASPRKHTNIGMASNDRNGFNGRDVERQLILSVLQQDGALLSSTCCATSKPCITSGTFGCGGSSTMPEANSVRRIRCTMASSLALGDLAALHRLLQRFAKVVVARHFNVQPGLRSFRRAVRSAPVG